MLLKNGEKGRHMKTCYLLIHNDNACHTQGRAGPEQEYPGVPYERQRPKQLGGPGQGMWPSQIGILNAAPKASHLPGHTV